jgi:hypothetical protein
MELQVMIIISILENIDCQSDFTDAWIDSYNNAKHFQTRIVEEFHWYWKAIDDNDKHLLKQQLLRDFTDDLFKRR